MADGRQHGQAGHGTSGAERPGWPIAEHVCSNRRLNALGNSKRVSDRRQLRGAYTQNAEHLALRLGPTLGLIDQDPAKAGNLVGVDVTIRH